MLCGTTTTPTVIPAMRSNIRYEVPLRQTSGCPCQVVTIYPTENRKKTHEITLDLPNGILRDIFMNPFINGNKRRRIILWMVGMGRGIVGRLWVPANRCVVHSCTCSTSSLNGRSGYMYGGTLA